MDKPDVTYFTPTITLRLAANRWAFLYRSPGELEKPQPTDNPAAQRDADRPESVKSGLGPILVVDDDAAIRAIVVEILELEGYPVEQAANGLEALRHIDNLQPSLILLDMRMPVLDGWGVARALEERGLRLPIVVMTAAQNARIWAQEIGATSYLAKPFENDDLLATVERHRG